MPLLVSQRVASGTLEVRCFPILASQSQRLTVKRDGVARILGVPDVLHLTPEAREAERLAEQERRRAGWRGGRSGDA